MSDRAGGLASSMAHSTRMEQKSVWVILLVLLVLLAGIGLLVLLMQAWSWIAGLAAVFVEGWFHRMPVWGP